MISSVPIYDYRCDHCGHAFSTVQSFNDAPIETCPSCGKRPRKLFVAPAIVFKGSGWYKTDSRGPAPKDEGKSETKSDAKAPDAGKAEGAKTGGAKTEAPKTDTAKTDTAKKGEAAS